ncbi:Aste57867_243 [Aphanomyces stellatus]|uniref:Aste57867_243 protein n=1 Tax=Aphanomyces stellatus TaxID=120398 RepID=A0A485K695_9STRA|nr:hypothetical protein As57867_000243 [Aphanomyces stellatus]VFT77469.1 Aste57867_243 [Aphanomyces stellatus]
MDVSFMRSNLRLSVVAMNDPIKFAKRDAADASSEITGPRTKARPPFTMKDVDDSLEDNQTEDEYDIASLLPLHSAVVSWKSPSHANEDRAIEYRGPRFSLFAVIDGHGGDKASEYVKNHLVRVIDEETDLSETTLRHATLVLERRFCAIAARENEFSGACFVALVLLEDDSRTRFVINCGDCRISALERGGLRPTKREYKALSTDHKASCPLEKARIMRAGGNVIMDRVAGVLAPSRSIGDLDMKMPGMEGWVIADPEITEDTFCPDSLYVLATDGVWDVMNNRDVLCLAETSWLDNQVAHDGTIGCVSACEAIAQESVSRGSRDDITCIVIRTGDWD